MREWFVAPGPASTDLALSLAKALNAKVVRVESKIFPDGESKLMMLDDVRNKPVIMVQSVYPPVDMHVMQALFLAHKLSEDGGEVHAVIPYLAYSRQDKEFLKGEVVSLGVLAHLLRSVGVKRLLTVDIHSAEGLGYFSFPAYSASAIPRIAEYFRSKGLKAPIAASPDFGGSNRVEAFAKLTDIEHLVLKKSRDRLTGEVIIETKDLKVEDRDVIILDDIISTGGSVVKAANVLKQAGARRIYAACTHALLVENALERILKSGVDEVIGTNTLPSVVSKIDVTPVLASYFDSM